MSSKIWRPHAGVQVTTLHGRELRATVPVQHSSAVLAFFPEEREIPDSGASEMQPTEQEKLEAAFLAGSKAGEVEARQALETQRQAGLSELGSMIASIRDARARLRNDAEADLVQLAFNIAKRILNRELNMDAEAITSLARLALGKVSLRELMKVRVHPEYFAALTQLPDFPSNLVEADATLNRGDLILETTRGALDASVDRQLAEIERGFADRLGGA
jgi:flagellar assembly protein FliH